MKKDERLELDNKILNDFKEKEKLEQKYYSYKRINRDGKEAIITRKYTPKKKIKPVLPAYSFRLYENIANDFIDVCNEYGIMKSKIIHYFIEDFINNNSKYNYLIENCSSLFRELRQSYSEIGTKNIAVKVDPKNFKMYSDICEYRNVMPSSVIQLYINYINNNREVLDNFKEVHEIEFRINNDNEM